MCLKLNSWYSRKKTAKEDIIVFKHLYKQVINGVSYYHTPYRNSPVIIGETYDSKLERLTGVNEVHHGLHSFESVIDCNKDGFLETKFDRISVVAKCIIPKGSRYYKGIFSSCGCKLTSYASDKLTYIEELFVIEDYD